MTLLKRTQAPILPEAWAAIDEEARRVLKLNLSGRVLVDFEGPLGWDAAAVNLGRLDLDAAPPLEGVHLGLRRVQPLIEARIPVTLPILELDNIARGAIDPDLDAVADAARLAARLEDGAIFNGLAAAGIRGIIESSPHAPIALPDSPRRYPHALVQAIETLRRAGIDGPYGLALGALAFNALSEAAEDGYPMRRRIEQLVTGPIVWTPAVVGAVLLSVRGGDFRLTVGQDLSMGFAHRERETVELYLTESFTFRVLEPGAAVALIYPTPEPRELLPPSAV